MKELQGNLHRDHDVLAIPNKIHCQILKPMFSYYVTSFLNIVNTICIYGDFPSDWRKAVIILKHGKDTIHPTKYIHIALTSCICKTMERMINCRSAWYLESHN